jgi:hypothetical protein
MAINFPNAPTVGQLWPSPAVAGQPVYQWDGQKWIVQAGGTSPVYIGDAPPGSPPNGALWFNSSNAQLYCYYNDGTSTQWVMISAAQVAQIVKNYIINGAMMVSQENGSRAVTVDGSYPVDQFRMGFSVAGSAVSAQQVVSATPGGSPNRVRVTCTTANATVVAGDILALEQKIEGTRVADFRFGSASAKTAIVRLGCRGPAGTYSVSLRNNAGNRTYIAEIVIAAAEANTDVVKSVVIPGDVTGTWTTDNTIGFDVFVMLRAGTTFQGPLGWSGAGYASANQFNFLGTVNNIFELFDVGLYQGSIAPPFVVPDFASELQLCQRYYELTVPYGTIPQVAGGSYFTEMYLTSGIGAYQGITQKFLVRKRVGPTVTFYSANSGAAGVCYAVTAAADKTIAPDGLSDSQYSPYISGGTASDLYRWNAVFNARL